MHKRGKGSGGLDFGRFGLGFYILFQDGVPAEDFARIAHIVEGLVQYGEIPYTLEVVAAKLINQCPIGCLAAMQ